MWYCTICHRHWMRKYKQPPPDRSAYPLVCKICHMKGGIRSKGDHWFCKHCGHYWIKNPIKLKEVDPEIRGTMWGPIQPD
jgi:hypothetical protein